MKELSLNILDITKNSVRAGASLIQISTREPDKKGEVLEQIETFVKYFIATYAVN